MQAKSLTKVKWAGLFQLMDSNWKQLAGPGQNVLMFTESDNVKIGDKVVIENEDLCLKKDKSTLTCDIILCSL